MTDFSQLTIAFLGGGAMGEALAAGVLAAGHDPGRIRIAEPLAERRDALGKTHGLLAVADAHEAVPGADAVVVAVKPGVVAEALADLGDLAEDVRRAPLWISIAAGISIEALEAALPAGSRVIRAMPNTPSLVGAGATAFTRGGASEDADAGVARELFEKVGSVWEAPQESLLDAVTGLSGSGPAYVFVLLEALSDAGVRMGLPRAAASELASQTVYGAARLALETGRHPGELKDQVTSPGGTTIAGVERLEARGFRAAIHEAVAAATRRSRELGS
ncbi:MAG: pyrroline-5-carboxylate reductase [Myxococcota bacterium]|nr:pyrroline-5-carboxylate reductase [Myxococcota bacterium]